MHNGDLEISLGAPLAILYLELKQLVLEIADQVRLPLQRVELLGGAWKPPKGK